MTDENNPLNYGHLNEAERGRIVHGVWTETHFLEMRDEDQEPGEGDILIMLSVELHLADGSVAQFMIPEPLLPGLMLSISNVWQQHFPMTGAVAATLSDDDLNSLLDPDRKHDDGT